MYQKRESQVNGCITVNGVDVEYIATSEDFLITDYAENEETTVSTYSYERTNVENRMQRPVIFAYNGGPGAASFPLHMGVLGPRRLRMDNVTELGYLPPFTLEDNTSCILDIADIVIYEPPGTGFNYFIDPNARSKYFQSDSDADVLIITIKKWLTAHNRWNAPLFLLGESYGSIRSALAADRLMIGNNSDKASYSFLQLSGVILLGPALCYEEKNGNIPGEVMNFMPIAATNWLYRPEGKPKLEDYVESAEDFAYNEYLPALALGNRLSEEKRIAVAERLRYYSGLPIDTILKRDLKIDPFWYAENGFRDLGISTGINDSRFFKKIAHESTTTNFFDGDASNMMPFPAMIRVFNEYVRNELQVTCDREYVPACSAAEQLWDFSTRTIPGEALHQAMMRNPTMKILFCTGYFDMLTTMSAARYSTALFNLPQDRITFTTYMAGHSPFLGTDNSDKMCRDLRAFVSECIKQE